MCLFYENTGLYVKPKYTVCKKSDGGTGRLTKHDSPTPSPLKGLAVVTSLKRGPRPLRRSLAVRLPQGVGGGGDCGGGQVTADGGGQDPGSVPLPCLQQRPLAWRRVRLGPDQAGATQLRSVEGHTLVGFLFVLFVFCSFV